MKNLCNLSDIECLNENHFEEPNPLVVADDGNYLFIFQSYQIITTFFVSELPEEINDVEEVGQAKSTSEVSNEVQPVSVEEKNKSKKADINKFLHENKLTGRHN